MVKISAHLLIFWCLPLAAHASEETSPTARAIQAFERGSRLFEAGEHAAALPMFKEAYVLSEHRPAAIFALAQCERALGMDEEAVAHFREFLATGPPPDKARDVEATVRELVERRARTTAPPAASPMASIDIRSKTPGLVVTVDGQEIGRTPIVGYELLPGTHEAIVADRCFVEQRVPIALLPGQRWSVDLDLAEKKGLVVVEAVGSNGSATHADIFVDGAWRGKTPDRLEVSACAQTIEVRGESGRWATAVALDAEGKQVVHAALPSAAPPAPTVAVDAPAAWSPSFPWLIAAAVAAGSAIVLDFAPSSARDGELGAFDFVPIGLYAGAAVAAVIGFIGDRSPP